MTMTKPRLVGINKLMIDKDHQELTFDSNRFRIGRSLEMDLCLLDLNISRLHCVFAKEGSIWSVFCKSSNGIRVNGERLEKDMQMDLKNGDTIKLAEQQIYYWKFYLKADYDESGDKMEEENHEEKLVKNRESVDEMEIVNLPDSNGMKVIGLGQDFISKNLLVNTTEGLEQTGIDKEKEDTLHKEIERINDEFEVEQTKQAVELKVVSQNVEIQANYLLTSSKGANISEDMRGKETEHNERFTELQSKEKIIERNDVKIVRPLFKPPNGYACAQDILRRVQNKMRLKKNKKESINISEDQQDQDDSILSTSTNHSLSSSDRSPTSSCNTAIIETSSQFSQIKESMPDACSKINACTLTIPDASPPYSQIKVTIPDTSSPIFRRATKKASMISKGLLKLKKLL